MIPTMPSAFGELATMDEEIECQALAAVIQPLLLAGKMGALDLLAYLTPFK